MLIGECERRGKFLVGIRFGSWDWEDEDLDTSLASGSEVDILVVFGELQGYVSSHGVPHGDLNLPK